MDLSGRISAGVTENERKSKNQKRSPQPLLAKNCGDRPLINVWVEQRPLWYRAARLMCGGHLVSNEQDYSGRPHFLAKTGSFFFGLSRPYAHTARRLSLLPCAMICLSLWQQPAKADEPLFGFTYTTDLQPKGKFELEQWSTTRFTKGSGNFWLQDNLTEISYGVSDKFQFSLQADYASTSAFENGPFKATATPEPFSFDNPAADAHYDRSRFISVAGEAIYRLLSPYTHPIGIALYVEPTIGPGFVEPESRLILQKNFRDDRLVAGFNLTYAPEIRRLSPDTSCLCLSETDINYDAGISYRFRRNWSAGFEGMNERELASLNFTKEINSGYFLGPTIHYANKDFFVTATFVAQMPWATVHSNTLPGAVVNGYDFDNDFEKYRVRIKFGWNFGAEKE